MPNSASRSHDHIARADTDGRGLSRMTTSSRSQPVLV
mgnify:CR=1 FL=1